jgi:outer membrane protein TolC
MSNWKHEAGAVLTLLVLLTFGGLVPVALGQASDPVQAPVMEDSSGAGAVIMARPGALEVLDLQQCVDRALDANDALKAERLRRKELDGQMNQALATGLPTLDLVGDWTRSRDPSFALDSTFGGGGGFGVPDGSPDWFNEFLMGFDSLIPEAEAIPAQSFLRANLNLNWTINPVKISGAVGAASLGIDRQEMAILSVQNTTVESTVAAYHSIIRAADSINAVEAQIANQRELLDIMKMRYELGMATRLDTLQAAVSLANLQPQLSIARAALENEGARLNSLMGVAPATPLSIANHQTLELDPLTDRVALEMAQRRPELEVGELFTDILRRNRKAQSSERYPYLTINGAYGYVGKEFDSLFDNGHDSWRASLAVNWTLFDGLLTKGLVAETDAQIRRTEAELTGQRRQVQVEVLELLANVRMAREVLLAVQLNLEQSQEVLEESLLMLELGKTSYLDVLVAEANRAQARNNLIDARYQVLTLTSTLKRAIGVSPLVPLSSIDGLVAEVQ